MRPPTAFRLFAALLAFCAALSSPALALAHGAAHEHERHEAAEVRAAATTSSASTTAPMAVAADDDRAPHPGLHAGSLAKIVLSVTLAPGSVPVVTSVPTERASAGEGTPPADDCMPAAVRTAPPDQPRAPPVL